MYDHVVATLVTLVPMVNNAQRMAKYGRHYLGEIEEA
jgi:hypothetical protein